MTPASRSPSATLMPFIATQDEEAQEEDKREYETLIAELQSTIAKRGKAIEDAHVQRASW